MAVGPDGAPGVGHMPLVRGDGAYDLMGRIGRYGRRFRIGARAAFTPEESGRLYLGMNDQYPADNWGCVRARVEGPLLAEAGGPLVSCFPETEAEVQVRPAGVWADSGITVRRGDRLLISAQGFWVHPGDRMQVDPNGIDRSLEGLRAGALLGRIGEHGQRFVVGALHLLDAPEPGRLYLAVNSMEPAPRARPAAVRAGWLQALRDAAHRPAEAPRPNFEGALEVTIRAAAGFKDAGDDRGLPCRLLATQGGTGGVAVAVSPDGKLLATDSRVHSVLLAHAATGAGIRQLRGHFDDLSALAFTADGRQLVSASHDRTLRLWDVTEGRCVRTYAGHRERVVSLAVSRDGARFASSSRDGAVLVWDAAAGRVVQPLPGHRTGAYLAFSPDGSRLASACQDGWLRLWDTKTWQCVRTVFAQCGTCWAVAWAPDGSRVAVGGRMTSVRIWDPAKGERVRSLAVPNAEVRGIAWSSDGRRLVAAGKDGTLRIWDAATFELARTIEAHSSEARSVALSPDGQRITSTGGDGAVRIWGLNATDRAKAAGGGEPRPGP
jgi:DNA-binding beta-propeller fold protein YncE